MISACITAQIDNGPKKVFKIKDADFSLIMSQNPTVTENNMIALSLLSAFFDLKTNDYWRTVTYTVDPNPDYVVGQLVDNFIDPNHPVGSLSLVSFTYDSVTENLARDVPPSYEQAYNTWGELLRNKSDSEVNNILDQYYPVGHKRVERNTKTLYIQQTNSSDLTALSEDDNTTYVDGYNAILACLNNTVQNVGKDKATEGLVSDRPSIVFQTDAIITLVGSPYDNLEPVDPGSV